MMRVSKRQNKTTTDLKFTKINEWCKVVSAFLRASRDILLYNCTTTLYNSTIRNEFYYLLLYLFISRRL